MKFLMKGVVVSSFLTLMLTCTLFGQQIKWMTFDEAIAAHQKIKKKIIVDIYTDWCN